MKRLTIDLSPSRLVKIPMLLMLVLGMVGCGQGPLEEMGAIIRDDGGNPTDDRARITEVHFNPTEVYPEVRNTAVTDAGLVHLEGLTNLSRLHLAGCTQVTDAGLAHLKGLKNLEELNLNGTQITDAGLVHLSRLTSLRTLYLDARKPIRILQLRSGDLRVANEKGEHLQSTKIGDAGLVHLKGLTSLEKLSLAGTQITDAGLMHLKGLTSLTSLYLNDTQVTDAGLDELKAALPQCNISR